MEKRMVFPWVVFDWMWRVLQRILPDKPYLKLRFLVVFHRRLNLVVPKTFNEKLQWLKLYGIRPEYSKMADKVQAKDYIASVVGSNYVIPTIGVWETAEEVDFDRLPNKFVLKCNHESGSVIVCTDKSDLNVDNVRKALSRMIKNDYYLMGRETIYKYIPRRILAEEYLMNSEPVSGGISDYKVHNFNGDPKLILVCQNRFAEGGLTEDFFTVEWEHLDLQRPDHPNSKMPVEKPEELDLILDLSRKLSRNIPFLRTDFYIVDHKVYVGELTFFPSSGLARFVPDTWDYTLGDWLDLPQKME